MDALSYHSASLVLVWFIQLALSNALRYFPPHLHKILAAEFAKELRDYGHIYMYRFRPVIEMKAYPIHEYPAKCRQAAGMMHMIMNNLDARVAQVCFVGQTLNKTYMYVVVYVCHTHSFLRSWLLTVVMAKCSLIGLSCGFFCTICQSWMRTRHLCYTQATQWVFFPPTQWPHAVLSPMEWCVYSVCSNWVLVWMGVYHFSLF